MVKQTNKDFDEFDQLLFKHFEKNKDVPPSTRYTIEHSLSNSKRNNNRIFDKIKRLISILVALAFLSTGAVFAKDIIHYIKSFFTNTNEGIETAANNGYIQNINDDFITSNGLSAKIDNIIIDDNNLDISFIYKYIDEDVDSINFSDVLIKDENDNVLYYISDDYNTQYSNENSRRFLTRTNSVENLTNGIYRESLLINTIDNVFPKSTKLKISVKKAYLLLNNTTKKLTGLWEFNIDLSNKFINRDNYNYTLSSNLYVTDYTAELTDTSLNIKLYFNTPLDKTTTLKDDSINLYDRNNNTYIYDSIFVNNFEQNSSYKSLIELHYNLTKYDNLDMINKLKLIINLTPNETITLDLNLV